MLATFALGVSVLLQIVAAGLSIYLIQITRYKTAWSLVTLAIVLMTAQRGFYYYHFLSNGVHDRINTISALVSLAVSIAMVSGLALVGIIFKSIQRAREKERKTNRALLMMDRCNQAIITTTDEKSLLDKLNRIIVELGGYRLAWVGFAQDDDRKSVKPVSSAGFEEGYLETVDISWGDNERGQGPTGFAIRTGEPATIRHIPTDPAYAPWREQAEKRGYKSSAAFPLADSGRILGALNIYSKTADSFDEEEVKLLIKLADNLSFGIQSIRNRLARERSQKALEKSEALQRSITSSVKEAIVMIDDDGKVTYWNPAAERMFGYTEAEAMENIFAELCIPAEFRERHRLGMESFRKTGQGPLVGQTVEVTGMRKDGENFPLELSISSAKLGRRWHATGVMRDISARKRAENALMESERALATLMGNLPGMAYRCRNDDNWTMEFVSGGCLELTGHEPADLIENRSLSYADLIHPEDRDDVWEKVQNSIRDGRPYQLTYRMKTADGQQKWVWEKGGGVFSDDGEVIAMEGFISDITERHRAERALEVSEKKYRNLFESATDGILIIDTETRKILDANKILKRRLGYIREEILRLTIDDINPPDLNIETDEAYDKLKRGENVIFERIHRRKDGSHIPVEVNASLIDYGGRKAILGFIRDITDRKRDEETLRKKTHDLGERVKELRCLYAISDLTHKPGITYEEMFREIVRLIPPGWQYPEITCARIEIENWSFATDNYQESLWRQTCEVSVHGRKLGILEVGYLEERPQEDEGPFLKEERELLSALATQIGKAVEGRRAQESLTENESRLRAITDTALDAIIQMDNAGFITYWNTAAQKIFGYSEQEALGKNLHKLIAPQRYYHDFEEEFEKFRSTGYGALTEKVTELTARRKNGEEFPAELSLSSVILQGKWHAVGIVRDITERMSAQEELQKSKDMLIRSEKLASLGALSAGVAHEIKNPLNIISTSAQLLMMEDDTSKEVKETCKTILDQVKRAVKITENLREFARQRKPEKKVIDLHIFIEKTIALVEYEMKTENIEIIRDYHSSPIYLEVDPDQLAQVFLNIASNARDSMNDKQSKYSMDKLSEMRWSGILKIQTKVEDSMVHIIFSDTGMGMSEDVINKVFDPFYTTKTEGKGTGLGMPIAYGIIENHKGRIDINSEEGQWAEFTVILPKALEAAFSENIVLKGGEAL